MKCTFHTEPWKQWVFQSVGSWDWRVHQMDWLDRWLVEGVCTHPDPYHSSYLLPVNGQKEIQKLKSCERSFTQEPRPTTRINLQTLLQALADGLLGASSQHITCTVNRLASYSTHHKSLMHYPGKVNAENNENNLIFIGPKQIRLQSIQINFPHQIMISKSQMPHY